MERLTLDGAIKKYRKLSNSDNTCYPEEAQQFTEWLEELKQYKEAEEQGLLLKLPCSENTTVYVIENNTDACSECNYFVVGYCCEDYCNKPNSDVVNGVYPQNSDEPVCEKQYLEVIEINPKLDWIFHNRNFSFKMNYYN